MAGRAVTRKPSRCPCPGSPAREGGHHKRTPMPARGFASPSPAHSNSPAVPSRGNKQQPRGMERSRGSHLGAQGHPQGSGGRSELPQTLPPRETRVGTRRRGSPHPVRARRDAGEAASAQGERARVPQPRGAPPGPPLPRGLAAALPERVSAAPPPTPPYIGGREGSPPPGGGSGRPAPIGTAPVRPHRRSTRPEISSAQPRLGPRSARPSPGSERPRPGPGRVSGNGSKGCGQPG
ncbi:proline-rich proteoglycan 2-like [Zonotrichia leucophrys gambelii]|uniref:proline-rich proteoglycan 2-like n=1 Tax=Zonotrichia leucophrys gambelii TaxID=257770 RepID=UPI00314063CB